MNTNSGAPRPPSRRNPSPTLRSTAHMSPWALLRPHYRLAVGVLLVFSCLFSLLASQSLFHPRPALPDRANPVARPTATDAVLPTFTPRPIAAGNTVLAWTTEMQPAPGGRVLVPEAVQTNIENAWHEGLAVLDTLPWEQVNPEQAFTGEALTNIQLLLANRGKTTASLTKTSATRRVFQVVNCNKNGSVCDVGEALGGIQLDEYDQASEQKLQTVALDPGTLYLLSGTMMWTGERWKIAIMDEPVTAMDTDATNPDGQAAGGQ